MPVLEQAFFFSVRSCSTTIKLLLAFMLSAAEASHPCAFGKSFQQKSKNFLYKKIKLRKHHRSTHLL
jgi:hypothetical protein